MLLRWHAGNCAEPRRRSGSLAREHHRVTVTGLDHVQLAMPPGEEEKARHFYGRILGLAEVTKPPHLAPRGGCGFENGTARIHLGVESEFRPAEKAHPALLVSGLGDLAERLRNEGFPVEADEPLPGYERAYVSDPFGNRIELMQPSL
jgi:catechol 2,3-dioxygenase-like lactoylglutathione lyase family enzyme